MPEPRTARSAPKDPTRPHGPARSAAGAPDPGARTGDDGPPLRRTPDYLLLWWGQSSSAVGDAVSSIALPLLAIETLHVGALQNGALRAAEQVAALFAAPLGVVVDRLRRRRLMIGADLARLLLTALVAGAALTGWLSFPLVIGAALLMGLLDSLFGVAYQSHLPDLLEERHRVSGTAQLGTGRFGALTAGFALGGVLVAAVGAARALLVDAGSFLVSALTLLAVRRPDPHHTASYEHGTQARGAGFAEGIRHLRANRSLATLALAMTGISFALSLSIAVEMLFLVQGLHASAFAVGVVYGVPVAAGVPGSWLSVRLMRRYGPQRVMTGTLLLYAPVLAVPPLVPGGVAGLALIGVAWAVFILLASAYNAANNVLRQELTPPDVRGRVNALIRSMGAAAKLVAVLAGGVLGTVVGLRGTMLVAAVAVLVPTAVLVGARGFRARGGSGALAGSGGLAGSGVATTRPPAPSIRPGRE
ncbi:MFS transporter [Streptacidiphilus jiangxiensis]|uniref:MFS transporter n=1 Tax=Streptacidiphilus jiangxiensis TaxID=235985 RepID=UPI0005A658F8|nr:MFS transporter [Streptacidiphilus jiangxiensis]